MTRVGTITIFMCGAGWLIAGSTSAPAQQPCDPTSQSTPVPVPADQRHRCGNGRIETYSQSCARVCNGGCGHPQQCTVVCEPAAETCDRRDFGEQSCEAFGYGGGSLTCARTCDALDFRRCEPCSSRDGVTCRRVPLAGLRDVGDVRLAVRDDGAAALFTARRGRRSGAFFQRLDAEGRARGAPRAIASTRLVPGFAATEEGYLVATVSDEDVAVRLLDPRGRRPRITWSAPGMFDQLDLAESTTGQPVLVTRLNSPRAVFARPLDPAGVPQPLPDEPLHAVGRWGRLMVVPLTQGHITPPEGAHLLPSTSSLATQDGDHLVVWQHGPTGEADVGIFRAGARVGGLGLPRQVYGAARVELGLPGGSRLQMSRNADSYNDSITGAVSFRARGPNAREPSSGPAFGGDGVHRPMYVLAPDGWFAAATFHPVDDAGSDAGLSTLLIARVRD